LTAEDIASKLYHRYLYDNTFYTVNKEQVKGLPPFFVDAIASIVKSDSISGTQLREIARTSPWLQIYKTAQPNPFAGTFLSKDILHLMSLTRWYEWVREHPQKPDEKVIDDDDMLDGWYLLCEREKPKRSEVLIESNKFNVENFVMARSPEEADQIWNQNNNIAKGILQHRAKQISTSTTGVKNQDLGDNRMDINIEANKLGFSVVQAKAAGRKG